MPADRLLDAVAHLGSEQVTLSFTDPRRAVVVRPFGYEGPGEPCALVMPIVQKAAETKHE